MWNFSIHKKTVKAMEAFDVLSSEGIDWTGSFQDTFKKYNFDSHDKMPTVYDLINFIKYAKNTRILDIYSRDKSKGSDLRWFCKQLITFVVDQLRHTGSPNADTLIITNFLAQCAKNYETDNPFNKIEIGTAVSSEKAMQMSMKNLISMRYETLNLLTANNIDIENSCMMYIMRGDDVKNHGVNADDYARNQIIERAIDKYPKLGYFKSLASVLFYLKSDIATKDNLMEMSKYLESFSDSGLKFTDLFSFVDGLTESSLDGRSIKDIIFNVQTDDQLEIYLYLRNKVVKNNNDYELTKSLLEIVYKFLNKYYLSKSNIEKLLQDDMFVEYCHNQGENIKDLWLFNGFSTVEVMQNYLIKNPEKINNFSEGALARLSTTSLQNINQSATKAQQSILKDGLSLLQNAIDTNVIKKLDPFARNYNSDYTSGYKMPEKPSNASPEEMREYELQVSAAKIFTAWQISYLDRMEQERLYTSISKEDLEKYASNMIILEFDANVLQDFLKSKNVTKFQIQGVDFVSGLWRGLFVPRFPTPSGQPVPAIVIRTDAYDSLEHHKQLSENLGFQAFRFTESTRRHEIAHALQYLAVGDVMLMEPQELNPELTEGEAYIMDPAELYARVHGDIPYLYNLFDSRIRNLTVSKKIYEAAKEQWIHDIVNEKIHLMSGGTNLRRLMMQDETPEFRKENFGKLKKSDGTEMELPDPLEAISKILARQRIKLEMIFHDLFTVADKREKRKGLISKKNRLKKQLESTSEHDYMKRINLEKELYEAETDLIKVGQELIVDVENVSTSVLKGYLKDYFTKISNAVAEGLLGPDVLNADDPDRPKSSAKPSVEPELPTASDISDITEFMIGQSKPIPGGRKIDEIIPSFMGKQLPVDTWTFPKGTDPNDPENRKRPKGNFPGLEPVKPMPQSNITMDTSDPNKTASVYNHRKSKG